MNGLRIEVVQGAKATPYLEDLARLRIAVFRAFPYLYEGDLEYERVYLATYAASTDNVFVLAFDGAAVVGASTAMPMSQETPEFQAPFLAQGWEVGRVFYYGESVLLPEYRGRGIGVRFFEEREAAARRAGRFDHACFSAVERPADHPLRPADYVPLDEFWIKRGYVRHPELRAEFAWRDLGETEESKKPMVFWMKDLRRW